MLFTKIFSQENKDLDSLVLKQNTDKISTEHKGETIILDMETGTYHRLDAVGSTIWQLLEQPVSFQTICRRILDEYDVSETDCQTHLLALLTQLAKNKLIVVEMQ